MVVGIPGVCMLAGQYGQPGWDTDWRRSICIRESHAILGQPVYVRCLHVRVARATHRLATHLIAQNEQEIRTALIRHASTIESGYYKSQRWGREV